MNKNFKNAAQAGFTLIELIVVIVVLGILAATALPKFVRFGGDARLAALKAAQGSVNATAAMARGKYAIDPTQTTLVVEGQTITYAGKSGYPQADSGFITAAGLNSTDYTTIVNNTATATTPTQDAKNNPIQPVVPAYSVAVIPQSVANTTSAANCYFTYTLGKDPTTAVSGDAPTLTLPATATAANCQ